MRRFPFYPFAAVLVALSVLLMGAGLPHLACGGACCGVPGGGQGSSTARAADPHSCCCDAAPIPCDLEQAPIKDLPDSALTAVPRVDAPAHAPVLGSIDSSAVPASPVGSLAHARPCAQGPPGPIYLRHRSLLC